jgi:hypothetical protein
MLDRGTVHIPLTGESSLPAYDDCRSLSERAEPPKSVTDYPAMSALGAIALMCRDRKLCKNILPEGISRQSLAHISPSRFEKASAEIGN